MILQIDYSSGLKHGLYAEWYRDASLKAEGAYHRGKPDGEWTWHVTPKDRRSSAVIPCMITGRWDKGVPDGQWEWKCEDGKPYLRLEFDRGRLVKPSNEAIDARLTGLIARETGNNPTLLASMFLPVKVGFAETPLSDAMMYLSGQCHVPIGIRLSGFQTVALPQAARPESYEVRLTEDSRLLVPFDETIPDHQIHLQMLPHVDQPTHVQYPKAAIPITGEYENEPLMIVLSSMLEPHGFACDFRYGHLWVTERASIAAWRDPTGVMSMVPPPNSALARTWEREAT